MMGRPRGIVRLRHVIVSRRARNTGHSFRRIGHVAQIAAASTELPVVARLRALELSGDLPLERVMPVAQSLELWYNEMQESLEAILVRIRPSRKRQLLRAVHDADLVAFLASLGALEEMSSGNARCAVCGEPVTLENLGAVLPTGGRVGFSCESRLCLEQVLSLEAGRD